MTQEDRKLLLTDLCSRLPYGVMILHEDMEGREVTTKLAGYDGGIWFDYYIDNLCYHLKLDEFKPYLRSMSIMTEEEEIKYESIKGWKNEWELVDWLNSHYFDYRGLIPMGLALEAPKDMYKID